MVLQGQTLFPKIVKRKKKSNAKLTSFWEQSQPKDKNASLCGAILCKKKPSVELGDKNERWCSFEDKMHPHHYPVVHAESERLPTSSQILFVLVQMAKWIHGQKQCWSGRHIQSYQRVRCLSTALWRKKNTVTTSNRWDLLFLSQNARNKERKACDTRHRCSPSCFLRAERHPSCDLWIFQRKSQCTWAIKCSQFRVQNFQCLSLCIAGPWNALLAQAQHRQSINRSSQLHSFSGRVDRWRQSIVWTSLQFSWEKFSPNSTNGKIWMCFEFRSARQKVERSFTWVDIFVVLLRQGTPPPPMRCHPRTPPPTGLSLWGDHHLAARSSCCVLGWARRSRVCHCCAGPPPYP